MITGYILDSVCPTYTEGVEDEDENEDEGAEDEDEGAPDGQDDAEAPDYIQIATDLLLIIDKNGELVSLRGTNRLPLINIHSLSIFQRLLSFLLYFATKLTEQPSMTYSNLEGFF